MELANSPNSHNAKTKMLTSLGMLGPFGKAVGM